MAEFFISHGSYLGIFLFMVLTGAGLPIPEEVAIVTAGVLSYHDKLNPGLAFATLLVGGLAGDCLMYYIGHHFGRSVVREHRWWAHFMTPEREAQMEVLLQKHGLKVLFVARFLVGLRSPVYLSAGILRLPFRRFLLFDLLCATTVIGVFFTLSYFFGKWITDWVRNAELVATAVVVVAVACVGIYYWRRHRRKRVVNESESAEAPTESGDRPPEQVGDVERIA